MSTDVDRINLPALPAPTRVGQATAIEQGRAVAEVVAAVRVAQEVPRDMLRVQAQMEISCTNKSMAERAFFAVPRAGKTVSGPSVHLARELARCFGNFQSGLKEMHRDDVEGMSEMMAYAWDVENNTRSELTFIVPHKRDRTDKRTGDKTPEALVSLADIYTNNANQGARRLRTVILGLLPEWYVDRAKTLCTKTLEDGGGIPLPRRIAEMVAWYDKQGIVRSQLEQNRGRASGEWTDHDVAQLSILGKSLKSGEISRDEAFPPPAVTVDEIQAAASSAAQPTEPPASAS